MLIEHRFYTDFLPSNKFTRSEIEFGAIKELIEKCVENAKNPSHVIKYVIKTESLADIKLEKIVGNETLLSIVDAYEKHKSLCACLTKDELIRLKNFIILMLQRLD